MVCRMQPIVSMMTVVALAVTLFAAPARSQASSARCEQCLAACASPGPDYPANVRPLRPPDDVHHESSRVKTLFVDARAQDPAFGGRNLDGAVAGYRGAVRLEPRNAEYRNYLAAALMRRKNYDEARYNLKKATEVAPSKAKYFVNLGYAHHKLGDEVRAMAAFLRAVALDPRNVKARLFAAHAFRALGLKDEAEAEYRRVLLVDPRNDGATKGLRSLE